jgi:hypothetical protein
MKKPSWFSLSFFFTATLLTLSIGSGGFTVVRDLYFYSEGKEPPQRGLLTFLQVCSITAAWGLWLKERQTRLEVVNPRPTKRLVIISASQSRGRFQSDEFIPWGEEYLALLCLYNDDSPTVPGVRAEVTFRRDGKKVFSAPNAYWLDERRGKVAFRKGSYRFIVLASWAFNEPVVFPYIHADSRLNEELLFEKYDVRVCLFSGDERVSDHALTMRILSPLEPGSIESRLGATRQEIDRVQLDIPKRD